MDFPSCSYVVVTHYGSHCFTFELIPSNLFLLLQYTLRTDLFIGVNCSSSLAHIYGSPTLFLCSNYSLLHTVFSESYILLLSLKTELTINMQRHSQATLVD